MDGERDSQRGSFLGPAFDPRELLKRAKIANVELTDDALPRRVAALLAKGNVVGWFQGRIEFGPRALGNRSILADPRIPEMQEKLNLKIKFRESFRPFAAAVMLERVADYFELRQSSPYMLLVAPVKPAIRLDGQLQANRAGFLDRSKTPRSSIPAVTHVDHSARVQTVSADENPRFYALLRAFEAQTGCAVLVNTSFNVRGEPPVCTPAEAFSCFMRTGMDYLVLGNFLVDKRAQLATRTTDALP